MSFRNAVHQYGGLIESLVQAFLSFAPVAAGSDDIESERTFQLIQSVSDLVVLRHDKYLKNGATNIDVCLKFSRLIHISGSEIHSPSSSQFPVVGRNEIFQSVPLRCSARNDTCITVNAHHPQFF